MKTLLTILFTITLHLALVAKPVDEIISIEGTLLDAATNQPVAWASIAIVGVAMGTITNEDGNFELKIPSTYRNDSVSISCVGYERLLIAISDYAGKSGLVFKIKPKNFQIQEINVTAESLIEQTILKTAIDKLLNNYIQQAFHYDVYYRNQININQKQTKLREAALRIYDSKGYRRSSTHQAYKDRGYKFLQVRKNFTANTLTDKSTDIDDLLEMDIVRLGSNILDPTYLPFYELKMEQITEYDGDSVWVINYKNTKPSLSSTGDYYAFEYEGTIFINKKDYSVVKNNTRVKTKNYSDLGRSYYVNENKQIWLPIEVNYSFTVIYKKHSGLYFLSYLIYNRHRELKHKDSGEQQIEDFRAEMMINKVETKKPEKITQRAYYEDIPFDKHFWENYNYMLDKKPTD